MITDVMLLLGVIIDAVMFSWALMLTFSDDFLQGFLKGTWWTIAWLAGTLIFAGIALVFWINDHPGHELVGASRGLEQWCNALLAVVYWRLTDKLVQMGKGK